jgi:hypothetical protein
MEQRWTPAGRLALALTDLRRDVRRAIARRRLARATRALDRRVDTSPAPLVAPGGPVVSLTSHGTRIGGVHRVIESIGNGTVKPSRIVLWLADDNTVANPPPRLARARARGLEIRATPDYGPHTKYFPFVMTDDIDGPLVTADDDVLYPPDWLERLVAAHEQQPDLVHCHRARRVEMQRGQLTPYNEWSLTRDDKPSHFNFVTGVSGVIYPPALLAELRRRGAAFSECCPRADDIWLSAVALRAGIAVAQIAPRAREFPNLPGSQAERLYNDNVLEGGNQLQLRRTYGPEELATLNAITTGG